VEVDVQALREDILRHCIYPTHIDAVQKSGQEVSFTPEQWTVWGTSTAINPKLDAPF
jgi:hypothetical protein